MINCFFAKSQVGINILNPQGLIDIKANKTTSTEDHFMIKVNSVGEASVIVGSIDSYPENASLVLNSSNKGLRLNDVSLKSIDDTETVPNPTDGMLVYNNNTSDPSEVSSLFSITPGVFFNQDKFWRRLYTVTSTGPTNGIAYVRDLATISKVSA